MTIIKTTIQNRRIVVPAPSDLPDGTSVVLTIGREIDDDGPMTHEEIERVRAAMKQLLPLEISDEEAADLDEWERKINQHGIEAGDKGIEEVFR